MPAAGPLAQLKRRLAGRADSEHEQAIIRVVIVALLLALFVSLATVEHPPANTRYPAAVITAGAYLLIAIGIVAAIIARPAVSPPRRLFAMVGDFTTMTLLLHFGNEAAAAIYPIYLWIAFGYGFRYGVRYLAAAVVLGFIGFLIVVLTTPFWREEWPLAAGLLFALIILPGYTASLIRKLTVAKAQAEAANVAKSRFLASMSHELRTPLNAVIGMSDVLADTPLRSDQQEMVNTVRSSGRALLSLIDDILDLTRIEAGRTAVVAEPFDVCQELAEVLSILQLAAANKGLKLAVQIAANVPHRLSGDRRHWRQVLLNLTANAVKFTEAGHVLIRIEAGPADIAADGPMRLRCCVTDTGIGIPAKEHARIFERFTQADDTVNRRYGGTGLGLAIAKALIHLMGGEIGVVSAPGSGSTFWFEIPVRVEDASTALSELVPMSVIVVSDDAELAETLALRLADMPFSVRRQPLAAAGSAGAMISEPPEPGAILLIDGRGDRNRAIALATRLADAAPEFACTLLTDDAGSIDEALPLPFVTAIAAAAEAQALARALRATAILGGAVIAVPSPARPIIAPVVGTILVAEDSPINQKVTRRILEHAGHRVETVGSGEAALDALARAAHDLLIVDVNMPGISGIELTKLIRMAALGGDGERLPIIALSADATTETRQECEAAGVDLYLTKPVEALRLLDAVDGLLAARPLVAATGAGSEIVTEISAHPRFRGDLAPPIDWQAVAHLRSFADEAFVAELLQEFADNTAGLLEQLRMSVAADDVLRFRELVHALRGTAGNVGATGLARICRDLHGMTRDRLASGGDAALLGLRSEFERFSTELKHHLAERRKAGEHPV
ncbi:MAG: ATP-binding protein [Rhodospirillales bacterium]|nr:ATP-binding protein [Rhodospirillales bacterium]